MKETEEGGSERNDAELAGIIFKQSEFGAPHSTTREFDSEGQKSRLPESVTRTIKSATKPLPDKDKILKMSLEYGTTMVLKDSL
jgi:hypothetical protein